MDSTELTVLVVACVLVGGLCLIATIIAIRRRCCDNYKELPDADPSNKLWVGANPTDAVDEEPDPIPFDAAVAKERNRKYVRLASNFCRSLAHERTITQLLPFIGPRETKFYCIVNDALVDREEKATKVPVLMTMVNGLVGSASGDNVGNWPDFTTSKHQARFKKLMCALNHPYVLPTYDVSFSLDKRTVFLVRPWSAEGSLRDLIFEERDPMKAYYEKYPQRPAPSAAALARSSSSSQIQRSASKRALNYGRGLRVEKIAKYGRQVLEGLKYFDSLALPYYHLHTGNVIVFNGACRLTDYENAYFGFHNRLHKKMKKMSIDPTLCSFGFLLYEMATGYEVPMPRKGRVELNITDPSLSEVVDVLDRIFHTTDHTVKLEEISSHRFFQVGISVPAYPKDRPDRIAVEAKMQRMIAPVTHYYQEKLYRKDDGKEAPLLVTAGDASSTTTAPASPSLGSRSSSRRSSTSTAHPTKKSKGKSRRAKRDSDDEDEGERDDGKDEASDDDAPPGDKRKAKKKSSSTAPVDEVSVVVESSDSKRSGPPPAPVLPQVDSGVPELHVGVAMPLPTEDELAGATDDSAMTAGPF